MASISAVSARKLSYKVGGHDLLRDISFEISPGSLCAIVGPSGAGKSTLLKSLCGVKRPTGGQALLAGTDVSRLECSSEVFGYVPQDDIVHLTLTVDQVLRYASELRLGRGDPQVRRERVDRVLELVRLGDRRGVRVRRLSGGQRKRVSIGVELIVAPRVLFLDEPTSGLDPGLERQMMQTLRGLAQGERTIVLTTHVMESMDVVDLLLVIRDGYLAFAGTPSTAPEYFNVGSLRDIFSTLEKRTGRAWAGALERFRRTSAPSVVQQEMRTSSEEVP